MKFESHFNYETGLIGRAQALYINHSTNYAVPIMIVSFFSILPSIIIRHNVTDIISACCMIICSALVLVTQRKRASIMTANLYKPETTIEANATIDDRFVSVELGNGINTLASHNYVISEMTDAMFDKHVYALCFNDQEILPIAKNSFGEQEKEFEQFLKQTMKQKPAAPMTSLYKLLSLIMGLFAAANIVNFIAYLAQ